MDVHRQHHDACRASFRRVAPREPKNVGAYRGVPPKPKKVGTALEISGVLSPQSVSRLETPTRFCRRLSHKGNTVFRSELTNRVLCLDTPACRLA